MGHKVKIVDDRVMIKLGGFGKIFRLEKEFASKLNDISKNGKKFRNISEKEVKSLLGENEKYYSQGAALISKILIILNETQSEVYFSVNGYRIEIKPNRETSTGWRFCNEMKGELSLNGEKLKLYNEQILRSVR